MSKVTIHEAKAKLASLIEEALSGEDVIIMRGKQPLARIVALPDIHKDPFRLLSSDPQLTPDSGPARPLPAGGVPQSMWGFTSFSSRSRGAAPICWPTTSPPLNTMSVGMLTTL